jgi:hypothetical protein
MVFHSRHATAASPSPALYIFCPNCQPRARTLSIFLALGRGLRAPSKKDIKLAKRLLDEYEDRRMTSKVKKKAKRFDAAGYLDSGETIAEYISEALLTGDMDTITHAIGVAAKFPGMSDVASPRRRDCRGRACTNP